jgi:hypothetical protein
MIKKFLSLTCLFFLSLHVSALEVGLFAGSSSQTSAFTYGLSAGMGLIVPMLKLEVEGYRITESELNNLSVAVKFRPKFGKFAPYAFLGAGGEFEKLDFHFSDYRFYTMVGGGIHFFISSMFSLRFDLRFLHASASNNTRFSGGVFIHL